MKINYHSCLKSAVFLFKKMTAQGATCQDCHLHLSFCVPSQLRACQNHQIHNLQRREGFIANAVPAEQLMLLNA